MTDRTLDPAWADEQFSRRESWRSVAPEPPELTSQCEEIAAARAHREQTCADCGEQRWKHGWKASKLTGGCPFVEHCDNADDPVLCKYDPDLGYVVAEAGCPVHDVEVAR